MNRARRRFLWALSLAPAFLWSLRGGAAAAQQPPPRPPGWPRVPENIPENPGPQHMPHAQRQVLLTENQKKIRRDVERLFKLATELRDEVARTDSSAVLSVHLVNKAGEIEKLARQIKDLARG